MELNLCITEREKPLHKSHLESIISPDQGNEIIEIQAIDENNKNEVLQYISILEQKRSKYNIHNIPSPCNIKRENYDDILTYKNAKEQYFLSYKTCYNRLNNEIKRLSTINTKLCFESKKKIDKNALDNGTFYTPEEKEYIETLSEKQTQRQYTSNKASRIYYEKNKEEIRIKRKIKQHQTALQEIKMKKSSQYENILVRKNKIIKPICLCGKCCDVIKFKNLQKHSKIEKHRLFKAVIALIHFKRREKSLKPVIDKINSDYITYKKVIRVTENGRSFTMTNKTDKDIIELYEDMVREIDEDITHQPRKAYLEKKKISTKYKESVLYLTHKEHPLLKK